MKDDTRQTAQSVLLDFLDAPLSDDDCTRFFVPKGTSRLKGLLMAQIARAYQGDSRAFEALMKVAYGQPLPLDDVGAEDALSQALRELADELDGRTAAEC